MDDRDERIPASALGAPHQRDRIWIIAYAVREQAKRLNSGGLLNQSAGIRQKVSDTASQRTRAVSTRSRKKRQGTADINRRGEELADSSRKLLNRTRKARNGRFESSNRRQNVGNAECGRFGGIARRRPGSIFADGCPSRVESGWWAVEPNVGRVAHGVASRVDRLKLLGNGQVVQVVEWIGKQIMEFEAMNPTPQRGGEAQ